MSNNSTFDAGIPVLTEVFRDEPATPGSGPADLTPSSDDWQALETRLSERILQRLQEEIRDSLPRIVAEAVAQEVAQLQSLTK